MLTDGFSDHGIFHFFDTTASHFPESLASECVSISILSMMLESQGG
jgi:hypothetical protein